MRLIFVASSAVTRRCHRGELVSTGDAKEHHGLVLLLAGRGIVVGGMAILAGVWGGHRNCIVREASHRPASPFGAAAHGECEAC